MKLVATSLKHVQAVIFISVKPVKFSRNSSKDLKDTYSLKGAQMPASLSNAEKADLNERAVSCITLCLGDKVLREVARESNAAGMWVKLESLYMTKSMTHKQFLKQKLYFYRMVESKSITEQLEELNKIIDDLANIDVNLEDEDKALHLLCMLPKSYESFKDTM
ncbi:hypothetical protein QL285_021698 [Trifolium repens]|nr:hypothetical protein QL285_021698 [Trifolium repens]